MRDGTIDVETIHSPEAIARHLAALLERDARLPAVAERAGRFEPRVLPRGFGGMARVICGQQLSVASANAIWGRLEALPGATDPAGFLALSNAQLRAAGLSAGKVRTLTALADAIVAERFDFSRLDALEADEAIMALDALPGIGPWTAEIYLMFCAGHPDVFPAGDLALQKAVAHAFGLERDPSIRELRELAAAWAPHRATAALLFWRYYAALKDRQGVIA